MTNIPKPNWKAAFLARCPACGCRGIFDGPVKVKTACPYCNVNLAQYETADGPAFFAISIIGTLVGLGAGLVEIIYSPPVWVHLVLWLPLIFLGSITIIRVTKALMIAHQIDLKTRKDHEGLQ